MIAACPKCKARYRIEREKLTPDGVRLRCTRCRAVFRVRGPAAPGPSAATPAQAAAPPAQGAAAAAPPAAPSPPVVSGPKVLLAIADEELAKRTADALEGRGMATSVVHDGVEAMLEIQRQLPRAAVLSATLPRMYGFQICEVLKRNESLRSTFVVLAEPTQSGERHRRPGEERFGPDESVEEPDLPEALLTIFERSGLAPPHPAPEQPSAPSAGPVPAEPRPTVPKASTPPPAPQPPAPPATDGLADERAKAERLARIIVSDIVLYNEAKFLEGLRTGDLAEALRAELDEGRTMLRARVDERVRAETDHLLDELTRVARARGAA